MSSSKSEPFAIVVMGPAGSGKTTVGRRLAEALRRQFVDADDHHSPANIEKMKSGVGLTDEDRGPWLETLGRLLAQQPRTILACSALKRSYRTVLRRHVGSVIFLYLDVPRDILAERLRQRAGHFAGSSLLDGQLEALEAPQVDESDAFTIDAGADEEAVFSRVIATLEQRV